MPAEHFQRLQRVALDVTRVYLRVVLPLFGQVVQGENRGDRADRHAGPTIDALYGIDVELRDLIEARTGVVVRCVLLGVDAIYGAGIDAGGAFVPMQGSAITKATRVATGIAPDARATPASAGFRRGNGSCCPPAT